MNETGTSLGVFYVDGGSPTLETIVEIDVVFSLLSDRFLDRLIQHLDSLTNRRELKTITHWTTSRGTLIQHDINGRA